MTSHIRLPTAGESTGFEVCHFELSVKQRMRGGPVALKAETENKETFTEDCKHL